MPIDAVLSSTAALDLEMVELDSVQRAMERAAKFNVLFVDACRDNPLAEALAGVMGARSAEVGRDLAPSRSSLGSLISFSTQPGNVALDGIGRTYLDRYPQGTYGDPARMLMARLERWEADDAKRRADRFQPGNPDARWRLPGSARPASPTADASTPC